MVKFPNHGKLEAVSLKQRWAKTIQLVSEKNPDVEMEIEHRVNFKQFFNKLRMSLPKNASTEIVL
jgi:hypothetical protein